MLISLLGSKSIQKKFSILMTSASIISLLLMALTLVLFERYSYQNKLLSQLNIQADIISQHLDVAMSFNDNQSAKESLSALGTNKQVEVAMVIDINNKAFATYTAAGIPEPRDYPTRSTIQFDGDYLVFAKPLNTKRKLGYLYIKHQIPPLSGRLAKYSPLLAIATITLAAMYLLVSLGARGLIIHPIGRLTSIANKISQTKDYSIRASLQANDEVGKLTNTLNELLEITETHQNSLTELAHYDPLTHLANRRFFHQSLDHAIKLTKRNQCQLALLFIDIDHFKYVNDTYGHEAGDEVLIKVAGMLQDTTRNTDIVARLAGDEFAIILLDINSPRYAQVVANKIIDRLSDAHEINGNNVYAPPSIGIAMYPGSGENGEEILRAADAAMYRVKQCGRQGVQFFDEKLQQEVESRNHILQALNDAIYQEDFNVVYQPKWSLDENRLIGIESLLRWSYRGQPISPEVFIPLAESSGKISEIGKWVLFTVCKQMAHWRKTIPQCKNMSAAVNVSPKQLHNGDFHIAVEKALSSSGLEPQGLEIEVTETAVVEDAETVINQLQQIRSLGVKISMDDFGTGYSSLSYLKQLPIDKLKIDKCFIMDIGQQQNDEALVQAVIAIAHSLNMTVIAEGVETREHLDFLTANHCNQVQGYYISKPLAAKDFEVLFDSDAHQYKRCFSTPQTEQPSEHVS